MSMTSTPQAVFAFLLHARALEPGNDRTVRIPATLALRGDDRLVFHLLEGAADDFLRTAQAVDRRGVDPVDADGHRFVDGADGKGVVLRAPAEFPVAAADGPGAQADGREMERRVAELSGLHGGSPISGKGREDVETRSVTGGSGKRLAVGG